MQGSSGDWFIRVENDDILSHVVSTYTLSVSDDLVIEDEYLGSVDNPIVVHSFEDSILGDSYFIGTGARVTISINQIVHVRINFYP